MIEKNEKTLGLSALVKMAATRTRVLENLLKFKPKSREKRKRLYKNLITALVQYERIETTINRCHDLSRVAERMIDLAKQGDEETINSWITKKDLIPKVFGHLLPRYEDMQGGYTKVYKIPPRKIDSAKMGIVEFVGNDLPPLLPSEEELRKLKLEKLKEDRKRWIPINGTPV
ncbi:PREDICTED: 50S ribosomal protein L17-like [Acropora digitifera]|uniref:50S ribosomal protein L17-like n=2 Tax=Acropora digitifera TaxID=70779 RepID=UPI00077AA436|nr:PREDICTED: 50S ribosomal protein L17-like [Acropora digitifera]